MSDDPRLRHCSLCGESEIHADIFECCRCRESVCENDSDVGESGVTVCHECARAEADRSGRPSRS